MAIKRGIAKFLANFIETGLVARKLRGGRPSNMTAEVRKIIKEAMRTNDEMTAKAYLEISVSLSALLRVILISTYARNREKAVLTFTWKKNGHTLAISGDMMTQ